MTEYKTLRVPEDAYVEARASKKNSETWGDFLQRCSENPPEMREFVEVDDALSKIDDLETEIKTIREVIEQR